MTTYSPAFSPLSAVRLRRPPSRISKVKMMPERLATLRAAVTACDSAGRAADTLDTIIAKIHDGATMGQLNDEIDAVTAEILVAAEKMRAAIHDYQIVERRLLGGL